MTTQESNALIAEFMDGVLINNGKMIAFPDEYIAGEGIISNNRHISDLHYHTSWDWLMPVLKKIDSYANEEMSIDDFDNYRNEYRMISSPTNYSMEHVYTQAVQFIKWWNENK